VSERREVVVGEVLKVFVRWHPSLSGLVEDRHREVEEEVRLAHLLASHQEAGHLLGRSSWAQSLSHCCEASRHGSCAHQSRNRSNF